MDYFPPMRANNDMMLYRVIVVQNAREYTVHTGDKMVRLFPESKLPEDIAAKLAMVKAYESKMPENTCIDGMPTQTPYIRQYYPEAFSDIGWYVGYMKRVESKMYCVVVSRDLLYGLRGES